MKTKDAAHRAPESRFASPAWGWAAIGARIIVGGIMIYSGLHKASAPVEEFMVVIDGYQILPQPHVRLFAHLVPWTELLAGAFLLAGLWTRLAAAATACLSASFFVALASTLVRGIPLPNCGCFGQAVHLQVWQAMTLDAILIGCAAVAWRRGRERLALDRWAEEVP